MCKETLCSDTHRWRCTFVIDEPSSENRVVQMRMIGFASAWYLWYSTVPTHQWTLCVSIVIPIDSLIHVSWMSQNSILQFCSPRDAQRSVTCLHWYCMFGWSCHLFQPLFCWSLVSVVRNLADKSSKKMGWQHGRPIICHSALIVANYKKNPLFPLHFEHSVKQTRNKLSIRSFEDAEFVLSLERDQFSIRSKSCTQLILRLFQNQYSRFQL